MEGGSLPLPSTDATRDATLTVAIQELHFNFGRHRVLQGVELTLGPGDCGALFGANGSGKSTLLGILATRYRPRRGRYLLDGREVTPDLGHWARSQLLFIGHATHLYGHLTPLENLRFFADLRGLRPTDRTLAETVAQVGLGAFARRPVRGFSAGMRKRLALSRVLLARPALLLLDEPYSALDGPGVEWLNGLLRDYLIGGGTLVMASHDPGRVAALPHRPFQLREGRLQAGPAAGGEGC
ncbi:MAG: heme ABC exporter ATP-binding protein CcmA [Magnetococcales bacterium]|nr:heme ABC exporter ATP-binding protein CcmA [Magnetococcales bacterium]